MEVAGFTRPKAGERVNGDAWLHIDGPNWTFLAIVDGLGHGPEAGDAAGIAMALLRDRVGMSDDVPDLCGLLNDLHAALRRTRGAVAGLAAIEPGRDIVQYAGIGGIEALVLGSLPGYLLWRAGLLGGGRLPKPLAYSAPFPKGALLLLHSDGVVLPASGTIKQGGSCSRLATSLVNDYARSDDDATVVVARRDGGLAA